MSAECHRQSVSWSASQSVSQFRGPLCADKDGRSDLARNVTFNKKTITMARDRKTWTCRVRFGRRAAPFSVAPSTPPTRGLSLAPCPPLFCHGKLLLRTARGQMPGKSDCWLLYCGKRRLDSINRHENLDRYRRERYKIAWQLPNGDDGIIFFFTLRMVSCWLFLNLFDLRLPNYGFF